MYCHCEVTLLKTLARSFEKRSLVTRILIYSHSFYQVFNNLKIDEKLQVPFCMGSTLAVNRKQISLIQSKC